MPFVKSLSWSQNPLNLFSNGQNMWLVQKCTYFCMKHCINHVWTLNTHTNFFWKKKKSLWRVKNHGRDLEKRAKLSFWNWLTLFFTSLKKSIASSTLMWNSIGVVNYQKSKWSWCPFNNMKIHEVNLYSNAIPL